jgi:hypothetical protein
MTEKSSEAYRRDLDRSPGEEISAIVEWGEESNAKAAVGHGVQ